MHLKPEQKQKSLTIKTQTFAQKEKQNVSPKPWKIGSDRIKSVNLITKYKRIKNREELITKKYDEENKKGK